MHAILGVQEVERMICLDEARVKRCGSLVLESVGWAKLLLITDKNDLLSIKSAKECFVLFNHSCFIHNDARELTAAKLLRAGFPNRGDDNWATSDDFLLK